MPKTLQHRRDTTTNLASVTGAVGEIFMDTTKNTLVVMDGTTAGGHPLALEGAGGAGADGATGPQGAQGDAGATGPQGAQGDAGATGPQGDAGPQGASGVNGIDGASGVYSGITVAHVTSLPGSPDANTLYIVTT